MPSIVILLRKAVFPLTGRIRSKDTGRELEGVQVILQVEPRIETVSRSNGAFRLLIPDSQDGVFGTLRAEKPGYRPYTLDVELLKEGVAPLDLEMTPDF